MFGKYRAVRSFGSACVRRSASAGHLILALRVFQCRHKASWSFECVCDEELLCWNYVSSSALNFGMCVLCCPFAVTVWGFGKPGRHCAADTIPAIQPSHSCCLNSTERYRCKLSVEWLNLYRWSQVVWAVQNFIQCGSCCCSVLLPYGSDFSDISIVSIFMAKWLWKGSCRCFWYTYAFTSWS